MTPPSNAAAAATPEGAPVESAPPTVPPTDAWAAAAEGTGEDEAGGGARLMEHAYDGIQEYDNPLPGWWSAIFIGSIVFAALYGLYFHVVRWGKSPQEQYVVALGEYESKKALRDRAEAANVSEQVLARGSQDAQVVAQGEALFKSRCASCHAENGSGLIGPNLTDLQQLHGTTRMDLYNTIARGVPGTAMLAWGDQMSQADVLAATAFVATLRGKNLPGKEPQGNKVGAFEE